MDILQDLLYTNGQAFQKTWKSLLKNWPIIFTSFFYITASIALGMVVSFFGLLGGIVMIAATSALLSHYLYLLDCIIKRDRITRHDFKDGFGVYLRKVWSISFILYLVDLVFSLFVQPILGGILGYGAVSLAYGLLLLILLNALPETIYQKYHQQPLEVITYAFEYVRDNWLEWFLPNILLSGIVMLLGGGFLGGMVPFMGGFSNNLFSFTGLLSYLLLQVVFSFAMIYRGYLYEMLSTSNRRKRLYMRKF